MSLRFRWSLRTQLIIFSLCTLLAAFFAKDLHHQYQKKRLLNWWKSRGATLSLKEDGRDRSALIAENSFDCKALKNISTIPDLELLLLWNTEVSDADLVCLRDIPELKSLALNNTLITDAGIQKILSLKKIDFLFLRNTKLTDRSIPNLLRLKTLKYLGLRGTNLSLEGIVCLKIGLPETRISHDLSNSWDDLFYREYDPHVSETEIFYNFGEWWVYLFQPKIYMTEEEVFYDRGDWWNSLLHRDFSEAQTEFFYDLEKLWVRVLQIKVYSTEREIIHAIGKKQASKIEQQKQSLKKQRVEK